MTQQERDDLQYLIERARGKTPTDEEVTEHRRSFAYGNAGFENPLITREMVDEEAEKIGL